MIIRTVPDLLPPLAALFPRTPGPYVALLLIGFGTGIMGHLIRQRWLVIAGIILIFLGAFLFPIMVNLTTDGGPPPMPASPQ
jgi:hypothetical protein